MSFVYMFTHIPLYPDAQHRGILLIKSNIPEYGTMKVICDNREIGSVFAPIDKFFLLNGRVWQIISIAGRKIYVRPSSAMVINAPSSRVSDHGAFYQYLPSHLSKIDFKEETSIG